jgi:hypothetical protein
MKVNVNGTDTIINIITTTTTTIIPFPHFTPI